MSFIQFTRYCREAFFCSTQSSTLIVFISTFGLPTYIKCLLYSLLVWITEGWVRYGRHRVCVMVHSWWHIIMSYCTLSFGWYAYIRLYRDMFLSHSEFESHSAPFKPIPITEILDLSESCPVLVWITTR